MAKGAYYFSHDNNARNDEKILAVRMRLGVEGYGIYFMILERLMESSDYASVKDYNIIAFDFRVGAEKVKQIVEDFDLFVFTDDGKYFYSESFNRRMQPLDNVREQRRRAGVKSAEKRAAVQQPFNGRSTVVDEKSNKVKKSKVKKSKVKKRKKSDVTHTHEEIDSFKKFQDWILEHAKSVSMIKEPFTIGQFLKLKIDFDSDLIIKILQAMHNWGDLKKRKSANLTFRRFAEKEGNGR